MVEQARQVKVIYVMGAGRSGSTILGVVLGNFPGFFLAGELDAWLVRSAKPNFGGERRERLWAEIAAQVPEGRDLFGPDARRFIDHSSSVIRPSSWIGRLRMRTRYREVAERLYLRLAENTGASHIVDTSHYPMRAHELQKVPGIDLYIIYLIRNPAAVVASFRRTDVDQKSKACIAANAYLAITNLLSTLVFLRQPRSRRFFLRYEEFATDPAGVLAAISDFAGGVSSDVDLTSLHTGLAFQGNRILRQHSVAFKADGNAHRTDPLTRWLQSPWSLLFGRLERATSAGGRARSWRGRS